MQTQQQHWAGGVSVLEGCGWRGREGQAAAGALDQPSSGPRLAACCISCHSRLLRCCRASFCPPFCVPSAPPPSVLPSPSPASRDRKGAAAPGRLRQPAAPTPPPNTHNRSPHLLSPPSLLPAPACCCFGCATAQAQQPQAASCPSPAAPLLRMAAKHAAAPAFWCAAFPTPSRFQVQGTQAAPPALPPGTAAARVAPCGSCLAAAEAAGL